MEERKLNIKKVIGAVVVFILLIVFIVLLTKYLTNTKQAAYASAEEEVSTNVASKDTQEDTWKINIDGNTNVIRNPITNEIVNTTTNTNTDSATTNNIDNNTLNVIDNTVANNTMDNTIANTVNETNTTSNTINEATETKPKKEDSDVKGVIWLTFDDGPSSTLTPKVLDILKKYDVKATFFILNYSDANEKIIKREIEEGHTVGVHGYSHDYSKIYKSKKAFWENVTKLQDKIQESTGVKTMYIRFPGGSSNTVSRRYCKGIMTDLTKEAIAKGYKYFDWNVSSGDAGGAKTSERVYKNITKNLSKKRGNMVLCHDIHKITLDALEDVIKYAKKHGYIFKAIDDTTPMITQHVNN